MAVWSLPWASHDMGAVQHAALPLSPAGREGGALLFRSESLTLRNRMRESRSYGSVGALGG